MADLVCEGCGKSFVVKRNRLDRRPPRHCSVACRRSGQYMPPKEPEVDEARERELEEARRMHADGMGWKSIDRHFGHAEGYFQRYLVPGYKDRRRQQQRASHARRLAEKAAVPVDIVDPFGLPTAVVAEIREKHARGYKLTAIPALLSIPRVPHAVVAAVLEAR